VLRADRNDYQDHSRKGNRSFSCMGRIDFWGWKGCRSKREMPGTPATVSAGFALEVMESVYNK
jgi:hypothetical protein